jgi:hypothetical protein
MMKVAVFENQFTRERFVCRDVRQARLIDGEEYLPVQRWLGSGTNATLQLHEREFLVKRTALKPVRV